MGTHFSVKSKRFGVRRGLISPLSPMGLALISYAIFFASTLIPPGSYEAIMQEPDRMFLDPASHALVAISIFFFYLGGAFIYVDSAYVQSHERKNVFSRSSIIIPLALVSALDIYSIFMLLKNNPNLLFLWLDDAQAAKVDFDSTDGMTSVLPMLIGLSWWGLWRLLEREHFLGKRDWLLRLTLLLVTALAIVTTLIRVTRTDLMPCVFGLILTYYAFKNKMSMISLRKIIIKLTGASLFLVISFILLSWLRGVDDSTKLLNNIGGYTVASYNRLASLLSGDLYFPYGGTGVYAFRFLGGNIPLLSKIVDVNQLFGMPASQDAWVSEFSAVYRSGLDGSYIWPSAFGYLYADIGFFIFIYMFFIGVASKILWKYLLSGRAIGVIIYPWVAFSILFWMGDNFIAFSRVPVLIGTAILMGVYEFFLRNKFTLTRA